MTTEGLKDWLVALIQGIVSHPEEVDVDVKTDEMGVLFTIHVHEDDRGKVIGRKGANANAIRVVLRCAGGLRDIRAAMKVHVPDRNNSEE